MRILFFTGAGASVELGMPAMQSMVEQFLEHLRERCFPIQIINKIERLMEDGNNDMEFVIDLVDAIAKGTNYQKKLGLDINNDQLLPFGLIRDEAEWFVQHTCERIQSRWAGGM